MAGTENPGEIFRAKINLETSKIAWKELQRFFAGGMAMMAAADLDLVEVAFQMSEDNVEQIRQWTAAGKWRAYRMNRRANGLKPMRWYGR